LQNHRENTAKHVISLLGYLESGSWSRFYLCDFSGLLVSCELWRKRVLDTHWEKSSPFVGHVWVFRLCYVILWRVLKFIDQVRVNQVLLVAEGNMLFPIRNEVGILSLKNTVCFAPNSRSLQHPTDLIPLGILFWNLDTLLGLESCISHLQHHIEYVVVVPVYFFTHTSQILQNEFQVLIDIYINAFVYLRICIVCSCMPLKFWQH